MSDQGFINFTQALVDITGACENFLEGMPTGKDNILSSDRIPASTKRKMLKQISELERTMRDFVTASSEYFGVKKQEKDEEE